MSCIGWIGGDVSSCPSTELAILICLAAVNADGVICSAVNHRCYLVGTCHARACVRVHFDDEILIAEVADIFGVEECDVNTTICGNHRDRCLALIAGIATLRAYAETSRARDLSWLRPRIPAVMCDGGKDRRTYVTTLEAQVELRPCDNRVTIPPGGYELLVIQEARTAKCARAFFDA